MSPANPLDSVYFVKIPADAKFSSGAMKIDPSIELPVQKKNRDDPVEEDFANLSEEQILSGILTVLAYDTANKNSAYYLHNSSSICIRHILHSLYIKIFFFWLYGNRWWNDYIF